MQQNEHGKALLVMENSEDFTEFILNVVTEERGEMELHCTPDNSTLYLHHPDKNPQYDHIFRKLDVSEMTQEQLAMPIELRRILGGFVWRSILGEEAFENIAGLMTNSCNFDVVYRVEPTDTDRNQYHDFATSQLRSELEDINPEDFL